MGISFYDCTIYELADVDIINRKYRDWQLIWYRLASITACTFFLWLDNNNIGLMPLSHDLRVFRIILAETQDFVKTWMGLAKSSISDVTNSSGMNSHTFTNWRHLLGSFIIDVYLLFFCSYSSSFWRMQNFSLIVLYVSFVWLLFA